MIEILSTVAAILPMWFGETAFCRLFPKICKANGWGPWR